MQQQHDSNCCQTSRLSSACLHSVPPVSAVLQTLCLCAFIMLQLVLHFEMTFQTCHVKIDCVQPHSLPENHFGRSLCMVEFNLSVESRNLRKKLTEIVADDVVVAGSLYMPKRAVCSHAAPMQHQNGKCSLYRCQI